MLRSHSKRPRLMCRFSLSPNTRRQPSAVHIFIWGSIAALVWLTALSQSGDVMPSWAKTCGAVGGRVRSGQQPSAAGPCSFAGPAAPTHSAKGQLLAEERGESGRGKNSG